MMAADSGTDGSVPEVAESGSTTFRLFAELRAWGTELPGWERLALCMLLEKGSVDEQDLKAIYQALLVGNGLAEPQEDDAYKDLSLDRIPESAGSERKVVLKRIRHVEGVNALVNGHYIDIGPNLTVVYGLNGSGKSGYARILKDSCFTRSRDRRILGNVYVAEADMPRPSAVVTVAVNSDEKALVWQPGAPLPLLRDYFVVFDTSCTRVSIDEQNVFVTPYGFDVFPGLVNATRQVRDMLDLEIVQRTPDIGALVPKQGVSRVSELLATLSQDTPIDELERLAVFGEDGKSRFAAVQKEIEQLRRRDPAAEIKRLEMVKSDLCLVKQKCEAASGGLSDDTVGRIRGIATELGKLQGMAEAASAVQFAEEPVQPVGTETWVQLVQAALAFSAEAYPDLTYPGEVEDVRCVLCQQPLSAQAKSRLQRFVGYVQGDVEEKLQKKRAELDTAYLAVRRADMDFFGPEAACRRSLDEYHTGLATQVTAFIEAAKVRRDRVLNAATEEDWAALRAVPETPGTALSEQIADVDKQVTKLQEANVSEQMSKLVVEQQLLTHREYLNSIISVVRTAVEKLRWIAAAQKTRDFISTRHITEKQKALVNKLVAQDFLSELRQECERLGANVPLRIRVTGELGETTRKLGLNGLSSPDAISEVLSEGEQQAIAIADFLAEVRIAGGAAGLVFDDPVCSLDDERKQRIASRLAKEAKLRQVLVFTHDVFFAHHLVAAADAEGTAYVLHTTSRGTIDDRPGHVDEVVFPHTLCEREALQRAEKCLKEAGIASVEGREEKLGLGCDFLRTAYENFVQHELFADIVRKWEERISYRLSDVYFDEDIAQRAQARMESLSRYIPAHSHSLGFPERPLSVDLLADELRMFAEVKSDYRSRRKEKREGKKGNEAN